MIKLMVLVSLSIFPIFANAKGPTVTLRYSFIFDSWCAKQTAIPVTESEQRKLNSIFTELQSAWAKTGPKLLIATEKILGKPFLQNEIIGTVFLCKNTPSLSMPLLINGNWFISETPQSTNLIVDIIYHELIHTYLDDNFPIYLSTPLTEKYKNEELNVRSHLHLMAVQKKIYLSLGLKDRIDSVIQFDSEHYKGAYKRAWEIVNLEGADRFVDELTKGY